MVHQQKSITELAESIAASTSKYNEYLVANGIALPTHAPSEKEIPVNVPAEIAGLRQQAIEASHELHELLIGPMGIPFTAYARSTRVMSLHFIYKNKIGHNLAWDETTTFEKIAQESKLGLDDTIRMMRLAIANYFFAEPQTGVVAHTAASHAIVSNPLLNAWIGVTVEENWPPMLRLNDAMQTWPDSEDPLQSAYVLAHDMKEMPFDVWERDSARVERFASAMKFLHSDSGFQPQYMVDGYDFASLGDALFVDVGGSTGHVSVMLAQKYPNITCIVQDLPATVKAGKEQIPEELSERVSFMSHDFWTEQPVKGADIYYFRWVFHDWSDSLSVKLLRQLIPALKPGARVLINDICIPPAGFMSLYQEQRIRSLDILMKTFTNAKERSAKEWAALFEKADPRFKFTGVQLPPGAKVAIIEAKWDPALA